MNTTAAAPAEKTFDVKKTAAKVIRRWYWLLASATICVGVAYLINRYTMPVYQVNTTVYLKEDQDKNLLLDQLAGGGSAKNLNTEQIILRSYALVEATVKNLDITTSYYREGKIKRMELYTDSPIKLSIDSSSKTIPYNLSFRCDFTDGHAYTIQTEDAGFIEPSRAYAFPFGKFVTLKGFRFAIFLEKPLSATQNQLFFKIHRLPDLVGQYQSRINIYTQGGKDANAMVLSLNGETPRKDIDFLDMHVANFMQLNVQDKNIASERSIAFINQLLNRNNDSLNVDESRLESFKSRNSLMEVGEKNTELGEDIKLLEQQKAALVTANTFFDYVANAINQNNEVDQIVIPSYVGIRDASLEAAIQQLTTFQLENKLLKADRLLKNPAVESNNQRIQQLKQSIIEKVRTLQDANRISLNDLSARISTYVATRQRLPSAERQYADIKRNYNVSESLVQFLLQKRAEAGIAQASNTSDYKIVDLARANSVPTHPKTTKNLLMAFAVGLAIPIGLILLLDRSDNKILTREDITHLTTTPIVGMIIRSDGAKDLITTEGLQKTPTVESFRTLRASVNSLLTNEGADETGIARTLLFTSTVSGEGKSFCARNMAYILAVAGKKTVLLNADMRKPYEQPDVKMNGVAGLSDYLLGSAELKDIVSQTSVKNLHIVRPGGIPDRPTELMMGGRMKFLLKEMQEHFDYIIIDTPPVGIISDGLELIKQADYVLYIFRQRYSLKDFITRLQELQTHTRRKNIGIVFNDVDLGKLASGYSYGAAKYGYGYYDQSKKKSWRQKLMGSKS